MSCSLVIGFSGRCCGGRSFLTVAAAVQGDQEGRLTAQARLTDLECASVVFQRREIPEGNGRGKRAGLDTGRGRQKFERIKGCQKRQQCPEHMS